MRKTIFDGVIFYEGTPDSFTPIQPVSAQLNSGFSQDQLKSLDDVKRSMADKARQVGGNCICDFRYGQRNGSIWKQLWSIDNVLWFGSGMAGAMPKTEEKQK